MNIPEFNEIIEPNDQTEARVLHLEKLRALVGNVYPNKFERSRVSGAEDTITRLAQFAPVAEIARQLKDATPEGAKPDQELKARLNEKLKAFGSVRISGRLAVPPNVMGKAAFIRLSDGVSRFQIYLRKQEVKAVDNSTGKIIEDEGTAWEVFKLLDHGDFVGVEGFLFLTNTGELSVHVETLQFLAKALLPMPDKMHGISDPELRRRYRYADLIASSLQIEHEDLTTREVFERRAKLIGGMRNYLDAHGFVEVETPMLTPKATGAAARAFETHHNALDLTLYARIAPELYLKRLLVGGFEKVYELNRNFRNEGLSHKHNPEFTMLEFYCAYMDVGGMMDFAEAMIKESVQKATGGSLIVNFDGREIDFSKFERLTMSEAVAKRWSPEWQQLGEDKIDSDWFVNSDKYYLLSLFLDEIQKILQKKLPNFNKAREAAASVEELSAIHNAREVDYRKDRDEVWNKVKQLAKENIESGKVGDSDKAKGLVNLFDFFEWTLIQPTFIIDYPKSISPLSKASPENPQIAERFELFINGMECANGFSELNDPREQYERFMDQMKERESGDFEAMVLDEDYIRALAYGMPPAAGIGIGIDRLVMLLTNRHSIRDVILFPHMRPEKRDAEPDRRGEAAKNDG